MRCTVEEHFPVQNHLSAQILKLSHFHQECALQRCALHHKAIYTFEVLTGYFKSALSLFYENSLSWCSMMTKLGHMINLFNLSET